MVDSGALGPVDVAGTGGSWASSQTPLAQSFDVALLDLDGVIYIGSAAVPHAAEALSAAGQKFGMRSAFVTNNASRPPEVVAEHLQELGIIASSADVVTSAQAGARVLAEMIPVGSAVLFIGGPGVPLALQERGFVPVQSIDENPVALIQGYGKSVGWEQMAQGSFALGRGLPWVATNLDRTIPTPRGRALGNGSMVAALVYATGATPVVAGKPEPPLMLESVERTAALQPIAVGDRLDTDIEGANRAGIPSLLVLTGVTDWPDLLTARPIERPTFISSDLRGLLEAHPGVTVETGTGWIKATCRGVVVDAQTNPVIRHEDHDLQSAWKPDIAAFDGDAGAHLDAVRAVCAVAWAAMDAGLEVSRASVTTVPFGAA